MANREIQLSDKQDDFINRNVEQGNFQDASDVIRAGLRLLQQQELHDQEKLRVLRKLSNDSFTSIDGGEFVEVNLDGLEAFLDTIDANATGTPAK